MAAQHLFLPLRKRQVITKLRSSMLQTDGIAAMPPQLEFHGKFDVVEDSGALPSYASFSSKYLFAAASASLGVFIFPSN